MRTKTLSVSGLAMAVALAGTACGQMDEDPAVINQETGQRSSFSVLGDGENDLDAVEVTSIADPVVEELDGPRDLEFSPDAEDELWVVNQGDNSTVVISNTGTDDQDSQKYSGLGSDHFLAKPAALAFNDHAEMATAQQTDEKTQQPTPADFMGPTLWPTDTELFDGGHASHLDMLHNSPLSSGIDWDHDISPAEAVKPDEDDTDQQIGFWVMDGYHGSLTHYDFVADHGPGNDDHSDGIVHRYADDQLDVVKGVAAHIVFDPDSELLYAADTGNSRIAVLDTTTGELGDDIERNYDRSTQKFVDDAELTTLVDGTEFGLEQPAGLEMHEGHLFVGDAANSTIYAFDLEGELVDRLDVSEQVDPGGLMGMTFDDEGRLYVTDAENDRIFRIQGD